MLAEDDDIQRAVLEEALRLEGFEVLTFEDGAELVDYLKLEMDPLKWPDAIVTDVTMPGHTGLEAAVIAREKGMVAPIFIVTGESNPGVISAASKISNTLVFSKPLDVEALAQAIWHLSHITTKTPLPSAPAGS